MRLSDFLEDIGRPVAYYPELARALNDVKEAIFICQMSYWTGKEADPDGWIYKSSEEIESETALSYKEQTNVRAGLKEKNLMQDRYVRTEHKLYFRINWDAVNTLWEEHLTKRQMLRHLTKSQMVSDQKEDGNLPKVISPSDDSEDGILPKVISLNGISENTAEITSENTKDADADFIQTIWPRVIEQLQGQMSMSFFDLYVRETHLIRYDGNAVIVGASDAQTCAWLESRLRRTAENLLIGILRKTVCVEFVVAEEVTA